jgi:hypothetical protein
MREVISDWLMLLAALILLLSLTIRARAAGRWWP